MSPGLHGLVGATTRAYTCARHSNLKCWRVPFWQLATAVRTDHRYMHVRSLRARVRLGGWLIAVGILSSDSNLLPLLPVPVCFSNLGDDQEAKHAAHSIKGAAANLMCHRVRLASMFLEKAGQAGTTLQEGEWDDGLICLMGPASSFTDVGARHAVHKRQSR